MSTARSRAVDAGTAAVVLLLLAQRHLVYYAAEGAEARGLVAKACGAVAIIGLAWMLYALRPGRLMLAVAALATLSDGMVLGASVWYMLDPWPIAPGEDMLSARVRMQIIAVELVPTALVTWWVACAETDIPDRSDTG